MWLSFILLQTYLILKLTKTKPKLAEVCFKLSHPFLLFSFVSNLVFIGFGSFNVMHVRSLDLKLTVMKQNPMADTRKAYKDSLRSPDQLESWEINNIETNCMKQISYPYQYCYYLENEWANMIFTSIVLKKISIDNLKLCIVE